MRKNCVCLGLSLCCLVSALAPAPGQFIRDSGDGPAGARPADVESKGGGLPDEVDVEAGKVPFQVLGQPLNMFLRMQAGRARLTYIENPQVTGFVEGTFFNNDPIDMSRRATANLGLELIVEDGQMRVSSEAIENNAPKKSLVYEFQYLRFPGLNTLEQIKPTEDYFSQILGLDPKTEACKFHPKTRSLVVHTSAAKHERLREILTKLDRLAPVISTQIEVYEVESNPSRLAGIEWTSFGSSAAPATLDIANSIVGALTGGAFSSWQSQYGPTSAQYAVVARPNQVSAVVRAMETKGLISTVLSLKAVGLDGEESEAIFARQEPVPKFSQNQTTGGYDIQGFEFKDIGEILRVTPQILPGERRDVMVYLRPEISSSSSTRSFASSGGTGGGLTAEIPVIDTRKMNQMVTVPAGFSRIIGGIRKAVNTDSSKKIPLLGDIFPYLFSNRDLKKETRDLAIIVTVNIETEDPVVMAGEAARERAIYPKDKGEYKGWLEKAPWQGKAEEMTNDKASGFHPFHSPAESTVAEKP